MDNANSENLNSTVSFKLHFTVDSNMSVGKIIYVLNNYAWVERGAGGRETNKHKTVGPKTKSTRDSRGKTRLKFLVRRCDKR